MWDYFLMRMMKAAAMMIELTEYFVRTVCHLSYSVPQVKDHVFCPGIPVPVKFVIWKQHSCSR